MNSQAPLPRDSTAPDPANWSCQIGESARADLPKGADYPMRVAIRAAYREVTGKNPEYLFSGWSDALPANYCAVVEDREPSLEEVEQEIEACTWRLKLLKSRRDSLNTRG